MPGIQPGGPAITGNTVIAGQSKRRRNIKFLKMCSPTKILQIYMFTIIRRPLDRVEFNFEVT